MNNNEYYLNTNVYLFARARTKASYNSKKLISVKELFNNIKTDNSPQKQEAKRLYSINKEDYQTYKETMPAVCFGSITNGISFHYKNIASLTGLVYLDIDDVNGHNVEQLKIDLITKFPFLLAAWSSISGKGIGAVAAVASIKSTDDYKQAYKQIESLFNELYGLSFCKRSGKATQKNVLSFDPNIKVGSNIQPYEIKTDFKSVEIHQQAKINVEKPKYVCKIYRQTQVEYHYTKLLGTDKLLLAQEGVYIAPKGLKFVRLPYHKPDSIVIGNRKKALIPFAGSLIFLNPHLQEHYLFDEVNRINFNWCQTPIDEDEIRNIIQYAKNNLNVKRIPTKEKIVWFTEDCLLTANEKRIIANRFGRAVRRGFTLCIIKEKKKEKHKYLREPLTTVGRIEDLLSELLCLPERITSTVIMERLNLSESTVKRNWKPFKADIQKHNLSINEKKPLSVKLSKMLTEEPSAECEMEEMIITIKRKTHLFKHITTKQKMEKNIIKQKKETSADNQQALPNAITTTTFNGITYQMQTLWSKNWIKPESEPEPDTKKIAC